MAETIRRTVVNVTPIETEEPAGNCPGWAGPCPEGMDWSEHLAMNNID